MMSYADAMNYFYSIAPITFDAAAKYGISATFITTLSLIFLGFIIKCCEFYYDRSKEDCDEKTKVNFFQFVFIDGILKTVILPLAVCSIFIASGVTYLVYNGDNKIPKNMVVESPYFLSLDEDSKQFIRDNLLDGDFSGNSASYSYDRINNDVDINKINLEYFSPNINLFNLRRLIQSEIEFRKTSKENKKTDKDYKLDMIKSIKNAK